MIRTTVKLDSDMYKQARKMAIDHDIAFTEIVNEALKTYLRSLPKEKKIKFELKVYNMGKNKGDFKRIEIYENI